MHLPWACVDLWGRGHPVLFTLGGGLQSFTLLCCDHMSKCQTVCWIHKRFSDWTRSLVASRQQQGQRCPPLKPRKAQRDERTSVCICGHHDEGQGQPSTRAGSSAASPWNGNIGSDYLSSLPSKHRAWKSSIGADNNIHTFCQSSAECLALRPFPQFPNISVRPLGIRVCVVLSNTLVSPPCLLEFSGWWDYTGFVRKEV